MFETYKAFYRKIDNGFFNYFLYNFIVPEICVNNVKALKGSIDDGLFNIQKSKLKYNYN